MMNFLHVSPQLDFASDGSPPPPHLQSCRHHTRVYTQTNGHHFTSAAEWMWFAATQLPHLSVTLPKELLSLIAEYIITMMVSTVCGRGSPGTLDGKAAEEASFHH